MVGGAAPVAGAIVDGATATVAAAVEEMTEVAPLTETIAADVAAPAV